MTKNNLSIRPATPADVATIFELIKQLAVYEKLADMVTGNTEMLHESLFGKTKSCECVVAFEADKPIGLHFISARFLRSCASPACIWKTCS